MNGKIIVLFLLLIPMAAASLDKKTRDLYFETFYLAGNDPEKVELFLQTLNNINADLSEEKGLSAAITAKAGDLGIDLQRYGNVKFAGENEALKVLILIGAIAIAAFIIYIIRQRRNAWKNKGY